MPRDPDVNYDLTIRRAGVERTVALTAPARPNSDVQRLSVSNLLAAAARFVLATMIALLRPELSISRHAYRTITNLPYDASGALVRPNGFGTINGVAPPRTLQLVTRVTF